MADDSLEIPETMDFHPCNTPRGCTYYNTKMLTECQQFHLNDVKLKIIKSDEKYLHKHPEIRGFIILILRHIFKRKPRENVPGVIREFFMRPREEIEEELQAYLRTRQQVEMEPEVSAEESEIYGEDYREYFAQLKPSVEEYQEPYIPLREINTEEYIRTLLLNRIRQFPSKSELLRLQTLDLLQQQSAYGLVDADVTEGGDQQQHITDNDRSIFDELMKAMPESRERNRRSSSSVKFGDLEESVNGPVEPAHLTSTILDEELGEGNIKDSNRKSSRKVSRLKRKSKKSGGHITSIGVGGQEKQVHENTN